MAHRGQFKEPAVPLDDAHRKALELIDSHEGGCAVFMVAGEVHSTPRKSKCFENNVERLANNLVGVYDDGADPRAVWEDLSEFYQDGESRPSVLPSSKWKDRIFEVLKEGPATPREIADELILPARTLSAYMTQLGRDGYIKVIGKTKGETGAPTQIWAMA
jgi:hypothetical protein